MPELLPLPGLPDSPPTTTTQTTTDTVVTATVQAPGWLHLHVRNIILLGVASVTCYLAVLGVQEARSALFATFISLSSFLFAERASLAKPGESK